MIPEFKRPELEDKELIDSLIAADQAAKLANLNEE